MLYMSKVSLGHLLSIDTFYNVMNLLAVNKGPDQTAHPRTMIRAFTVRSCPKACFRMVRPTQFNHGLKRNFIGQTVSVPLSGDTIFCTSSSSQFLYTSNYLQNILKVPQVFLYRKPDFMRLKLSVPSWRKLPYDLCEQRMLWPDCAQSG